MPMLTARTRRVRAVCVLLLLITISATVLVTPLPFVRACSRCDFLLAWGSNGSGDGQFGVPVGVAVDSWGNVYVADSGNARVQKFTGSGTYLAKWGSFGSENGNFSSPSGVAVDSWGNVYVADLNNHRVQKFNGTGTFIAKWGSFGSLDGQFKYPRSVAVDSSGNVYVADLNNHRVQKFTGSGTYLTQWGSAGSGDGQFGSPTGVAVDSSRNVYVVDSSNDRVQKFTGTGAFITKWGSPGSENGNFSSPTDVAVNSGGSVYVTEYYNYRVQKFGDNTVTIRTSTGFGNVTFSTKLGWLCNVTAVSESVLSTANRPSGVVFPYGFFNFTISNLTPGETVNVTIRFPGVILPGAEWWRIYPALTGTWTQLPPSKVSVSGNILTLTLTDGNSPDDDDGSANGVVVVVGGLSFPQWQQLSHGTSWIALNAGWNLVSLPVVPDNTNIAVVLKPILSRVSVVWSYSAASKTWSFFNPPSAGSLKMLQDGVGYWIFMVKGGLLNVTGSVIPAAATPPTYQLGSSWNLIGFKPQPIVQNQTVAQYLRSILGGYDVSNVWIYDNSNGAWIRATSSTWLVPGQALWILVTSPSGATLKP